MLWANGGVPVLNADDDLISRSRKGEVEAFEALISHYQRQVYTVAYRFMGNHDDASDLAQEAFIRAFYSIKSFRGDSSFKTWIHQIVANVCRDELRKRQRQQTTSLDEPFLTEDGIMTRQTVDWDLSPEQLYEEKEGREYLQKLIDELPPEYRIVLVMREIQDMTYEEIASQLDCSLGTIKSRLSRARKILRDKIINMELSSHEYRQIK
ncbi:MAG: RNA polymerase sigma factor [Bacillota bacterium]